MPVKPIALALAAGHQAAADARETQKRAAQAREEAERRARGQETLERSPLHEWFPDTKFSIIDYTGVGTSLQYQSNGTDIIVESDDGVQFGLSAAYDSDNIEVQVVQLMAATGGHVHEGPYYAGQVVDSALEVGLILERWKT